MADAVAVKKKPTKQEVAERQIRRGEIAKARLALDGAKRQMEEAHEVLNEQLRISVLNGEQCIDECTGEGDAERKAWQYAQALFAYILVKYRLELMAERSSACAAILASPK